MSLLVLEVWQPWRSPRAQNERLTFATLAVLPKMNTRDPISATNSP